MPTGSRRPRVFDDRSPALDRFGLLLAFAVASIVVFSLVDLVAGPGPLLREVLSVMATSLAAVTLLLALRASGLARHWQRVADVVIAVIVAVLAVTAVLRAASPAVAEAVPRVYTVVVVVAAVLAPIAVIRRLLRHRRVTTETVIGAVAGYLLIPLAFFYLFLLVDSRGTEPFFGRPEPSTSFMYFSLATLTTVGYGDLAPATSLDRLLAASEALVGQIYLVTFVALIVGLFAVNRQRGIEPDPSAGAATPDDDAPGQA